jgi:multicomponent Na+:H+ antiporter subunit A
MIFLVMLGFLLAFAAPIILSFSKKISGIIFLGYPLFGFIYFLLKIPSVSGFTVMHEKYLWAPSIGVNLNFSLDGLSLLFSLLITGIGALVIIYANKYMEKDPDSGRFFLFLLMFMASMLGLVLADNIFCVFIFWELTSISSFFLIGHKHKDEESRKSALQALLLTAGGGLAMLAGFIIIYYLSGSTEISEIIGNSEAFKNSPLFAPALYLLLLGCFTKSAQFPFHFWLPGAMTAPTPVSAYLHSATMVKAGIYLLARLSPIFSDSELWVFLLTYTGSITMLTGALLSVLQKDLKKILAYSTVSSLGTMVMLLGIGGEYATKAFVVFLVVHSLYKGAFFLIAGTIDHETGTRNIQNLGGLKKAMPFLAIASFAALLSNAGIPPLFGFIGKELIYEAALTFGEKGFLFTGLAIVSNILLVVAGLNAAYKPFSGKLITSAKAEKISLSLWLSPFILAIAGLVLGLFPGIFANNLISAAVSTISGEKIIVQLMLWHGFNVVLLLSAITVLAGAGFYFLRVYNYQDTGYVKVFLGTGPSKWYHHTWSLTIKFAALQTRILQNGYMRFYLLTILVSFLGLSAYTLLSSFEPPFVFRYKNLMLHEVMLLVIILIATLMAVFTKSRLAAVAALGLVGYGVALIFVLFGAPDIAMTQFTIDTLTVILFVLILYKLPPFLKMSSKIARIRDMVVSLATGCVITFIILYVTARPSDPALKNYFAENSYILAHGRNIVNVILVDFRSLDTMMEITVLAVAAIGVYALLKLKPGKVIKQE